MYFGRNFSRAALCPVAIALLIGITTYAGTTGSARAGWANTKWGVTHVPIAPIQTRTQLSNDISISDFNTDGPIPAAELATLKMHAPFMGKTDAEIQTKMDAIRENVVSALGVLRHEDPELWRCLFRAFYDRRLCIEFSGRKIAGVTNANSVSKGQLGGIAIKNPPCQETPVYDPEMIKLMSTLAHEALHLKQTWPPARMPTRIQPNVTDIGNRIQFQANEIAASQAEKKRLQNLFQVFSWLEFHDEPPPDDPKQGFEKLPLTNEVLRRFMKRTPANMRRQEAGKISTELAIHLTDYVCHTLKCRQAIKSALDTLRTDIGNGVPVRTAGRNYRNALRGSRDASGWFKALGNRALDGLFKVDISAGGLGEDTNSIRTSIDGVSESVWTEQEFITDVLIEGEDSLIAVGSTAGTALGTICRFTDTDGDGYVEQGTMQPLLTHQYLYGSNTFCRAPDGDLYLLNQNTLMFFRLDDLGKGLGIEYQGTIGDPDLDDINFLQISDDGLEAYGLTYADTALTPEVEWKIGARISTEFPFGATVDYRWFDEAKISPSIERWPQMFDMDIRLTGSPGQRVQAGWFHHGIPQVLEEGTVGPDGFLTLPLGAPPEMGDAFFAQSPGGDDRSAPLGVMPQMVLDHPTLRPDFRGRDAVDRGYFYSQAYARPGAWIKVQQGSDGENWNTVDAVQADGWGRATVKIEPTYSIGVAYQEQLRIEASYATILSLNDDNECIAPMAPTTFSVAKNDDVPEGTRFELVDPPLHADILSITNDGKITVAPLVGTTMLRLQYRATTPEGEVATAEVTLEVQASKLCEGPLGSEVVERDGVEQILLGQRIYCLRIGGQVYPLYQFRLANHPEDACQQPHWHASGFVYSIDETGVISDPDPPTCGFGKFTDLRPERVFIAADDWLAFKQNHPPR